MSNIIDKINELLKEKFPDISFKVIQNEDKIKILHNNPDKIGDKEFIEEVLEFIYDSNTEYEKLDITCYYDFLPLIIP